MSGKYYRVISPFVAGHALALVLAARGVASPDPVPVNTYLTADDLNTEADPERLNRLIKARCIAPTPVDTVPVVTAAPGHAAASSPAPGGEGVAVAPQLTAAEARKLEAEKLKNSKARAKPDAKAAEGATGSAPPPQGNGFAEGDKARLKSGGPVMEVTASAGEDVTAKWGEGLDEQTEIFKAATLELVEE